jgi:tetrahydromethanopterin S-methyltransferase subunit A
MTRVTVRKYKPRLRPLNSSTDPHLLPSLKSFSSCQDQPIQSSHNATITINITTTTINITTIINDVISNPNQDFLPLLSRAHGVRHLHAPL